MSLHPTRLSYAHSLHILHVGNGLNQHFVDDPQCAEQKQRILLSIFAFE